MTDPILYWNAVALEANRVSHTNGKQEQTGPTLSSRALAIVHLAMYDAYAGTVQQPGALPPYMTAPAIPAPNLGSNPSPDLVANAAAAAVAAAATTTLSALFPSQKETFQAEYRRAGLLEGGLDEGHRFGFAVAQRLLKHRAEDPGAGDTGYTASLARGAHRPDPDNPNQGFHAPFYGARSRGFAITQRWSLPQPPRPGSAEYQKALREVRAKGIAPQLMGTLPNGANARTARETVTGIYWGYDGAAGLGTPPRLYNQIIRRVAQKRNNTPAQNARLFALVNAAMGDAGILAWEQKYCWDFWRPVVGVREEDRSMGPAGEGHTGPFDPDCDPEWLPLGAPSTNAKGLIEELTPATPFYPSVQVLTGLAKNFTPPFPAYPSGHATFGAAAFQITRLFYEVPDEDGPDDLFEDLEFVSDEFNGENQDNRGTVRPRHVRKFKNGLWQMIIENGESRVFLGVHWLFDAFTRKPDGSLDLKRGVGGVPLGLNIARDIFEASRSEGWISQVKPSEPPCASCCEKNDCD